MNRPANGTFVKWALGLLSALILGGMMIGARELLAQGKGVAAISAEHQLFAPRFGALEERLRRIEDKLDRLVERSSARRGVAE